MTKQKISLLTTAILIFVIFATAVFITFGFGAPKSAAAEDGETGVATVTFDGNGTAFTNIVDAWDYANGLETTAAMPAKVTMFADITITNNLSVSSGKYITLDLNGHILKFTLPYEGAANRPVVWVHGNFTLIDSNTQAEHSYYANGDGLWVFVGDEYDDDGTQTLKAFRGGVITGGMGNTVTVDSYRSNGGGVFVDNGATFTMKSGAIAGNTSEYGGGVGIYDGTFIMENGIICGNKIALDGGGVCVKGREGKGSFTLKNGTISNNIGSGVVVTSVGSKFNMIGGTICDNTVTGGGGGLAVSVGAVVNMSDGTICNNTASGNGGGVMVGSGGTFNVSGTPIITGNYGANGVNDNVSVYYSWYESERAKITVSGNLDSGAQIGVHIGSTGCVITGFTQNDDPSAYFIPDDITYDCLSVVDADGTVDITTHNFWGKETVITDPTCTEAGVKIIACLNDPSHTTTASIPAIGHSWEEELSFDETYHWYDCANDCGETLNKQPHTFVNGVCECGFVKPAYVAQVTFNGTTTAYVTVEGAFAYANSLETTENVSAVITLLDNATTTDTLTVAAGKFITLDLNGKMLQKTGNRGSVISVSGNFTLTDSNAQTEHLYKIASDGHWLFDDGYNKNDSDVNTHRGGVITGGTGRSDGGAINQGGGVYVASTGTFTMENGSICGNTATNEGGGVYVASTGTFTMKTGTICGNFSYWSGGVYVGGSFEIFGAPIITGNKVNGSESNVYLPSGKTITVVGALTNPKDSTKKAQIGVTLASGSGVFTADYSANNKNDSYKTIWPRTYFTSDDKSYVPTLDNEQVKLVEPIAVVTVGKEENKVDTKFGDISEAFDFSNGDGITESNPAEIRLLGNVETTNTLFVDDGKFITLDLNGYMLKYTSEKHGAIINVYGDFTLTDTNTDATDPDKIHEISDPNNDGSTIEIAGGLITGVITYPGWVDNGGVVVRGGTFTMKGGNISGIGLSTVSCTPVYVFSGTLNMSGGKISGNTATNGGGVYVSSGEFNMSGTAEISGNTARNYGGGVYVSSGEFNMSGTAEISGNTARNGGGVYVSGAFNVQGAANISGNKQVSYSGDVQGDNNVYLPSGKTITVTGALTDPKDSTKKAQIGVTLVSGLGDVATGFTSSGIKPSEFFVSDDPTYNCIYVSGSTTGTVTIGEHNEVTDAEVPPTCTASGKTEGKHCSVCGTVLAAQNVISSLDHDFDTEWTKDTNTHYYACKRENCEEKNDEAEHNYVKGKCTVCGMAAQLYWGVDDEGVLTLSSYRTDTADTEYVDLEGAWQSRNGDIASVTVDKYAYAPQSMLNWFSECQNLTRADLKGLDTSSVTDMSYMFIGCSCLTSLDLSTFDTSGVTDMSRMFYNCIGLTSLNLSMFDTSGVTDMSYMFSGCSGLTSLDLSTFDTSGVTTMGDMFYNCSGLTSLDLSMFDTSGVTAMSIMFCGCSGLTSLDLSTFDTSSVTTMSNMFRDCSGLTSLNLSTFDTSGVTVVYDMFYGCNNLVEIKTPKTIGKNLPLPDSSIKWWTGEHNITNGLIESGDAGKTVIRHAACVGAPVVKENEVAATCSAGGSYDAVVYCSICNDKLSTESHTTDIDPDNHKFGDWHAEVGAKCTDTGTKGHKDCTLCNKHFGSDNSVITDLTIPAKGHTVVIDIAVDPTCTASGKTEGKHCSVCGEVLIEQITVDALGHTLVHNPAIPATESTDGNIEYWECEECEKIFDDEDGKTEVTDKSSVVIPKLEVSGDGNDIGALWITFIVVLSTIILFEIWLIISRKTHYRRKGDK